MADGDFKILPGDRASYNPVVTYLPPGIDRPPLRGLELVREAMAQLGQLQEDPDELILSEAGAKRVLLDLAQNYLDARLAGPRKGGWRAARTSLDRVRRASADLQKALAGVPGDAVMVYLRTGGHEIPADFLARLQQLEKETMRALEAIPENNLGNPSTVLYGVKSPNEMLVLGCQNLLVACGQGKVGIKPDGPLERLAKLVARVALGAGQKAGGIPAAARSEAVKGRCDSQALRIDAMELVRGDIYRRRGAGSALAKRVDAELRALGG